jgi:hypothetical protein
MAEIEPISNPPTPPDGAAPADTTVVPTAPVEVTPAAGAPAPAGAPASRPRGLVRWGVALIALAVMIGVVSVAAALLAAGGSASSVEGWLPKDTIAYLEIRADLPGDQRAKVGNILAKFPGFADQSTLDAKIDEAAQKMLEGSGVTWTTDIKPWLGGEVGAALTSAVFDATKQAGLGASLGGSAGAQAPDDGAVLLASVKDAAAAKAWVSKQIGGSQATETYAGGEITVVSGPLKSTLAFTVRGNVLIIGPEKTVKAALDTGGSSPVPGSAPFAAARKAAPSAYLGFGYMDVKAFVDASLAATKGQTGDLPAACLDEVVGLVPAWASGSMLADDNALVFTTTTPTVGDASSGTKNSASAVAAHLPGTTLAAIEFRDAGPRLVAAIDALKKQLACSPAAADAVKQVEQALAAIGGADALVGWAGDTAIAVEYDGGTFGGGLASVVKDEAAAKRTLTQLQSLLVLGGASAGITTREESYGGATLLVVTLPSQAAGMAVPDIAVTVHDGVFVLGTLDFVKGVVGVVANSSLATTEAYKAAISAAGGEGVSDVFVDLAGIRNAAEQLMPASAKAKYETEVKPFLVPFEAFASVAKAPTSTTDSRSVITFTK